MSPEDSDSKALTYSRYLRTDELLSLQVPLSEGPEHDEMLFIIIHQVYELWFKQVLHELGGLRAGLEANETPGALATLKRILQRPGEVILVPSNSAMEAMHYPPERVRIQGVVVGQMRAYR